MSASLHRVVQDTFAPTLDAMAAWLEHDGVRADVVGARLAPDMYTLAQQVQLACHHAEDAVSRLRGRGPAPMPDLPTDLDALRRRLRRTARRLRDVSAAALRGAERRDCSIPIPGDQVIAMNGTRFLLSWALPHFYFHAVIAYGILRHRGVPLGKTDYLAAVGAFIRPALTAPGSARARPGGASSPRTRSGRARAPARRPRGRA